MATVILTVTVFGLINPYLRYWMSIQSFMFLGFGGFFNGYISARMMRFYGSNDWRFSASASAACLPMYLFSMFAFVDIIEWIERSSSYLPFTSAIGLAAIWVAVAVPLSYAGAYCAFTTSNIDDKPPCKVSPVRRHVPAQAWYMNTRITAPVAGLAIFGTIFGEFQYVLMSVWRSYMYGMFVLLWWNLFMLVIVVAIVSILVTYLTVQGQDWNWWWRSFLNGAAAGGWMFLYSVYAMVFDLKMNLIAGDIIYLIYMGVCSTLFGVSCGAVSLLVSYAFLHEIYSKARGD